jgi:hypothetical protein
MGNFSCSFLVKIYTYPCGLVWIMHFRWMDMFYQKKKEEEKHITYIVGVMRK